MATILHITIQDTLLIDAHGLHLAKMTKRTTHGVTGEKMAFSATRHSIARTAKEPVQANHAPTHADGVTKQL